MAKQMNFAELKLVMAIRKTGAKGREYVTQKERIEFAVQVQQQYVRLFADVYFPFTVDNVIHSMLKLRKNRMTRTKADIAIAHGTRCFWHGRNVGPCSEECEAGHLVPACRGGELSISNCIIECRAHNNERRERTIEEYLEYKTDRGH